MSHTRWLYCYIEYDRKKCVVRFPYDNVIFLSRDVMRKHDRRLQRGADASDLKALNRIANETGPYVPEEIIDYASQWGDDMYPTYYLELIMAKLGFDRWELAGFLHPLGPWYDMDVDLLLDEDFPEDLEDNDPRKRKRSRPRHISTRIYFKRPFND